MKWYSKAIVIICNIILLNVANQCMAVENTDKEYTKDNQRYIDKIFYIEQDKEKEFINNISKEIVVNDITYIFEDSNIEQQFTVDTKQIQTTKKITLNTNDKDTIINKLGMTIDYKKDDYIGEYELIEDSIKIVTHNNGYYDKLIEKTQEYENLDKNDLDYIPKQITYKGKKLDLLNTKWEKTETTQMGESEVPSKYKAICYYATKERIYRPNTYTITAEYIGEAKKEILKPSKITVTYKEKIEEKPVEKKDNMIIPVVTGTGTIVIFLGGIFLFMHNAKVYNYQKGKWVYIGKALLINKKISLNKFRNKEVTNKYRIEFSKVLTKRYNNKTIIVKKGTNKIKQILYTNREIIDLEIRV